MFTEYSPRGGWYRHYRRLEKLQALCDRALCAILAVALSLAVAL